MLGVSLGGCADTPELECSPPTTTHHFENKCAQVSHSWRSPREVCHLEVRGQREIDSTGKNWCHVRSQDGIAWLDHDLALVGPARVTIHDAAQNVVFDRELSNAPDTVKIHGTRGMWNYTFAMQDASGTGYAVLWG